MPYYSSISSLDNLVDRCIMSRFLSKSYPLRIHIASLFLVLILLACGSISVLFYVKSRNLNIYTINASIRTCLS